MQQSVHIHAQNSTPGRPRTRKIKADNNLFTGTLRKHKIIIFDVIIIMSTNDFPFA